MKRPLLPARFRPDSPELESKLNDLLLAKPPHTHTFPAHDGPNAMEDALSAPIHIGYEYPKCDINFFVRTATNVLHHITDFLLQLNWYKSPKK